jgi:RHS repeat-associated protein
MRRVAGFAILVASFVALGHSEALAQTETIEYYALDAVGSVRVVFEPSGTLIGRIDFMPFGEELGGAAPRPTERFAGLFRDGEAGLDYAKARAYQIRTGRFASADSLKGFAYSPQSWNRYSYALNAPLAFTDPSGLMAEAPNSRRRTNEIPGMCDAGFSYETCGGDDLFWAAGYFDFGNDFAWAQQSGYVSGMPLDLWTSLEAHNQRVAAAFEQVGQSTPTVSTETSVALPDGSSILLDAINDGLIVAQNPAAAANLARILGQAGERAVRAVRTIGDKTPFVVNGVTRIADGMLGRVVTEIKNVGYQALTRQMADYLEFLRQNPGMRMDLIVRESTKLSKPLEAAIKANGRVEVIPMLPPR